MKIINLLPKEKQKELQLRQLFNTVVSLVWVTAASFILVLLVLFGVKAYLQGEQTALKASIEDLKAQAGKEENAVIKSKVQQANDLVADYLSLSSQVPRFSKVVPVFPPLIPA